MTILKQHRFVQDLKDAHGLSLFVETGTSYGEGVASALGCGFRRVYSCDLLVLHYEAAQVRFRKNPEVLLWHEDSLSFLDIVLGVLKGPAMFWLDGHLPNEQLESMRGGETWRKEFDWPHMDELRMLRGFEYISGSVVLCDDLMTVASEDNPLHREWALSHPPFSEQKGYSVGDMKSTLSDVLEASIIDVPGGVLCFSPRGEAT